MTTTVFVHFPSGESRRPDVVWWKGPDGELVERVIGEDTAEVKTARFTLMQKLPSADWNEMFEYLGEFSRGTHNWDTHHITVTPEVYVANLLRSAGPIPPPMRRA